MILSTHGILNNSALYADNPFIFHDVSNVSSYPGSGNTLYDLSGNNHTATLYDNSPYFVTYSSGNGGYLNFSGLSTGTTGDGTTGLWANDILKFAGSFSASIWVNLTTIADNQELIATFNNVPAGQLTGWAIRVISGKLRFTIWNNTSTQTNLEYSTTLSTGTWYNVGFSRTLSTGSKLFVNSVLVNSDSSTIDPVYYSGGVYNVYSCFASVKYTNGVTADNTRYLNGAIGHILVYNRALSDAEFLQNFNASKVRFGY